MILENGTIAKKIVKDTSLVATDLMEKLGMHIQFIYLKILKVLILLNQRWGNFIKKEAGQH
jgi:hypothetical protein